MKCWVHPQEDAVAVCKSCSKGVCQNCAVSISGDVYCKACVESRRIFIPPTREPLKIEHVPTPKGVPIKALFTIGGAGNILTTIASMPLTLVFFGTILAISQTSFRYYKPFFGGETSTVPIFSILVFTFIGIIFAAIGYLGAYKNYGSGVGAAGFAFSLVAAIMFMVYAGAIAVYLSTEEWEWRFNFYYYSEAARVFLLLVFIITCILFGIMLILWGATHIVTRRFTGHSGLSTATGIMMIVSGALTLSTILSSVALSLLFVTEILATILFFIMKIPELSAKPTS